MSKVLQEKFEVRLPRDRQEDHEWKSDKSARAKKGTPGREGRSGGDWESKSMDNAVFYGTLPPGTDIEDIEIADIRKMNTSFAGTFGVGKNAGDVSTFTASDMKRGYTPKKMRPTDDQYTREHNDAFYDEVSVDGETGFLERNNVLDRL